MEKILARNPITESPVQMWAEMLAHELRHRSRGCLDAQAACEGFQDAKPALKANTLRRRREPFDWINELTMTIFQVEAVRTQRQAETARRLAVETWLQRNGVFIGATGRRYRRPVAPWLSQVQFHSPEL